LTPSTGILTYALTNRHVAGPAGREIHTPRVLNVDAEHRRLVSEDDAN
jgi:hypothetical protein